MTDRYADYDAFAWLYSNHWGEEFHRQAVPALDSLLLRRLPKGAAVLDLCCGDGRITQELVRRGFQVTGIDGSEQMLSYAQQRVPQAKFLLADARTFTLPARFAAVVSTFDSLNHVMTTRDLRQVFDQVYQTLAQGGMFVFDLNREEAYRDFWVRDSHIVHDDSVSVVRGSYLPSQRTAHCDITLFRLDNAGWRREDFRLSQRFHRTETVVKLLSQAGFTPEVFDAARDLKMKGDIGQGRNFYLGTKR